MPYEYPWVPYDAENDSWWEESSLLKCFKNPLKKLDFESVGGILRLLTGWDLGASKKLTSLYLTLSHYCLNESQWRRCKLNKLPWHAIGQSYIWSLLWKNDCFIGEPKWQMWFIYGIADHWVGWLSWAVWPCW